ncbi:tetratricopeptide repeat protein [Dactylosporangium sp. NPDC049742]|uniref:tetratricopeptide repeat protein n=1 Tax=Dactylosporangium sp. NPDC049742 TaxID=3154737 RepID=UPI00342582F4
MAMLRPLAEEGQLEAVERLGALLVRQGEADEVLAMVRRALADPLFHPIDVAVELTRGMGRDEEVIGLLRPVVDAGRGLDCLLASVLERDGRMAEAVAVQSACIRRGPYAVEDAEQLADLLARHDPAALADLAAGGRAFAVRRLARWHEEQGRIDDAVAVLAPLAARLRRKKEHGLVHHAVASWLGPVTAAALNRNAAWLLADLLARHGRVEEALAVLRPAASADPALVRPLCLMLIGQGRPDEARAAVAEIVAEGRPDPVTLRLEWIEALVACGRHEQAIAELRADPEADGGYARERLAALLACHGAPDEAIAMLGPDPVGNDRLLLAKALIRAGRPQDAIAMLRARPATTWV